MKKYLISALCAFAVALSSGGVFAQSKTAGKNSDSARTAAVNKVRSLFFERDFTTGYETGQKLLEQFPDDEELKMWVVQNGGRAILNNKAVLEMAVDMVAAKSESVYALIALAMASSYNGKTDDALKSAEKAIKVAPDNEEAIFTYNSIIFRAAKYNDSLAWLDKNAEKIADKSRFYNVRGISGFFAGKKEQAFKDFETSIKVAPPTVNSLYLYADYLGREKRYKEALPILKHAVLMAPYSLGNRVAYWQMLSAQPDKTDEQKEQEIAADMNSLLKAKPNSPDILYNVSIYYGTLKNTEKKEFYEEQILKKFPNSQPAEGIIVSRIIKVMQAASQTLPSGEYTKKMSELAEARLLGDKELLAGALKQLTLDKATAAKIDDEWRAFLKRPRHFEPSHMTTGRLALFYRAMYDFEMPDEKVKELFDTLRNLKNERQNNIAREIGDFLAVRKAFGANPALTADLLAFAKAGMDEAEEDIAIYRGTLSPKDLEEQSKYIRSKALQTLGLALYLENRFDEAEKELLKAREMSKDNLDILLTLALVYRAKKEYDKAEDIYLTTASISRPLIAGITELYRSRNGGLQGFDAYYKTVKDKIRARTMTEIAASRIKQPKDLVPFDLKNINQGSISSADIKGKIVVINFWGVWCGPCVKEMPEIQELAAKYKNDNDVAILTFDVQDDLTLVRKFIADRKYDFPVLVADSYMQNLVALSEGTVSYPTTLFVDKSGKISFIKSGNTGNLVEEFSLRIDILRQDK